MKSSLLVNWSFWQSFGGKVYKKKRKRPTSRWWSLWTTQPVSAQQYMQKKILKSSSLMINCFYLVGCECDQQDSLWPLNQRITIMLCLSSGVTVAAGLKERQHHGWEHSDTSTTHRENNTGWRTDYPYATALTYIHIQRSGYLYPHRCPARGCQARFLF